MNAFDLLRPRTLKDALLVASSPAAPVVKAGGIDLLDRMKEGLDRPPALVDILGFPELRQINDDTFDGIPGLNVGALVTLAELAASPLVRERAPALAEAAHSAATPQVRAQATVGGNLYQQSRCWYYRNADFEPCLMRGGKECFAKEGRNKIHAIFDTDAPCVAVDPSSLAPALVALDAKAVHMSLAETGETKATVSVRPLESIAVKGRNALASSEKGILTNVFFKADGTRRSAFRELSERASFDWALASCAVSFDWKDGLCSKPRIVLGAVSLKVRRCEEAESLLASGKLTPELARAVAAKAVEGAKPLAENGYKVAFARAVVSRAILAAAGMEEKK
jgi:xanthine dehydrogenase YagS FAD-binding subunit